MKKVLAATILPFFLVGCSEHSERQVSCVKKETKIVSIKKLGTSGNDGAQAGWAAIWAETGLFLWIIGWPVGMAAGSVVWGALGAGLGTFVRATDYEVVDENGTNYTCQEKDCEDITGSSFTTDGKKIFEKICSFK